MADWRSICSVVSGSRSTISSYCLMDGQSLSRKPSFMGPSRDSTTEARTIK